MLVQAGADADEPDNDRYNAFSNFILCADSSNKKNALAVAACLYNLDVDINCVAKNGLSPLFLSASFRFRDFPELTEKLLQLGANPNLINNQGDNFVQFV